MTQRTDASERYAELPELVEQLRGNARMQRYDEDIGPAAISDKAAEALLALLADNKALREALEDMADLAQLLFRQRALLLKNQGLSADVRDDHKTNERIYRARAALASALPDPKENKT